MVAPSSQVERQFCSVQVITNYRYKRQHFVCISTFVHPVTSKVEKIYESIDTQITISLFAKIFLSSIRIDKCQIAQKKFIEMVSNLYTAFHRVKGQKEEIPGPLASVLEGCLGVLKSLHDGI